MERIKFLDELCERYVKNDILFDIDRKRYKISLLRSIISSFKNVAFDSSSEISLLEDEIKTLKSDIQNLYDDLSHIRHPLLSFKYYHRTI